MQKSLLNLIYQKMIFFLSLTSTISRNCSPSYANEYVDSRKEQQKV